MNLREFIEQAYETALKKRNEKLAIEREYVLIALNPL